MSILYVAFGVKDPVQTSNKKKDRIINWKDERKGGEEKKEREYGNRGQK